MMTQIESNYLEKSRLAICRLCTDDPSHKLVSILCGIDSYHRFVQSPHARAVRSGYELRINEQMVPLTLVIGKEADAVALSFLQELPTS